MKRRKGLKVNFIYITIYIVIVIVLILITYAIIELLTLISKTPPINSIIRRFIECTFGWSQPAMWFINIVYEIINVSYEDNVTMINVTL